jgi:hypothetical protein
MFTAGKNEYEEYDSFEMMVVCLVKVHSNELFKKMLWHLCGSPHYRMGGIMESVTANRQLSPSWKLWRHPVIMQLWYQYLKNDPFEWFNLRQIFFENESGKIQLPMTRENLTVLITFVIHLLMSFGALVWKLQGFRVLQQVIEYLNRYSGPSLTGRACLLPLAQIFSTCCLRQSHPCSNLGSEQLKWTNV